MAEMPTRLTYNGHTMEGTWQSTENQDYSITFDGEMVCGPHDEKGNHIATSPDASTESS